MNFNQFLSESDKWITNEELPKKLSSGKPDRTTLFSSPFNSASEFQLDLKNVKPGDVLDFYESNPNTPDGSGTVVKVKNSSVELTDIQFTKKSFNSKGSGSGDNRTYTINSTSKKLNGWKLHESTVVDENTSSYGGRAGLTKDETLKIAQKFADAAASVDHEKGKWTVNKRTLEEDGFDLDYNGEEFDGGSYNIYKNGNVVNMAIRPNLVLGKVDDDIKTIAKGFKKMMNESVVNEANLVLGLSTNNYPAGTSSRYRIESTVINLRKVADLSKDSWKKYSKAFANDEIGFESANDRKTALAAIQKSFDSGQNDIREFGLNESKVNEEYDVSGVSRADLKDAIDYLKSHDISHDYDGREDTLYFDMTELDKKGQELLKKLGIHESVVNERNITIKRQYTDKSPAVTVGKAAKVRNRMLEAIKDGKLSQEEFNTILKEMTSDSKRWLRRNAQCFNVSEDGITLSKTGSRILKNVMVAEATEKAPKIWVPGGFDKEIAKYPNQKITRKIVLDAALKWDVNPEDAIQYVEYAWMVDLDENKNNNNMKTKFIYESFQEFVENKLNEGTLNEAFKSAKLANLFSVGSAGTKNLAGAFYNFSKLALDQIQDYDIIEMDPQTARKEKRANAIYFYVTTNQKENPYIEAGRLPNTYNNGIIQSNTLLAMTNGQNEWYSTGYNRYSKTETISKASSREDAAGFDKRDSKRYDGSGITSITKVAELADIAYVIDLDVLKARYSTNQLTLQRADDKRGATAFQSDKDFKAENKQRYNEILAKKAAAMPMDAVVLGAIDTLATQIKDGLSKGEKGRYGELIIGLDPRGREIKMNDAANLMRNILDEYNRYVGYVVETEKEVASGYSGKFAEGRLKQSSKTIVDYVKKVESKNYAW